MREPALDYPDYKSTALRHPKQPLLYLPEQATEMSGPQLGHLRPGAVENDLTKGQAGEPVGERIVVSGRLLDCAGRPIADSLVEIWQANAAGRYAHRWDRWPAPLDPNFTGGGRTVTDSDGAYEFVTIKPGPYPWGNHYNAWRPAHIHFSLLGQSFEQRLVTQMYFPGDPLFRHDPIFNSVRDERARERMVSQFSIEHSQDNWALAYKFDIVLGGRSGTPIAESS
ncbi:MAG: protocatechuate 3,4-dioxygenase subunit beta [Actinomycetota bacterium]|nr:protocatechuate 3,4-dioxygenase subunit beta [Actinomycetota bacterium]